MKFGDIELKYGLFLAPMAGFTDRAMRLVCHNMGSEYSVTEMVSAKAVVYGDKKTHALAKITADEGPAGVQIFGSEPSIMAKAAELLQKGEDGGVRPQSIDINMGCPVHKIYSNGEGSALMKNPDLIYDIVTAVSQNIDIPCTVKIRAGVDRESVNAVECALAVEAAGASLVAVHGRTKTEMYSGNADYEIVKNVKKCLKIPVIANGDIVDAESAVRVLSVTGADGIMIGRGAIGNPFVFSEIIAQLKGEKYEAPTLYERIATALFQLRAAIAEKGEGVAVREARKQIAMYLRSFRGAAALRSEINRAGSYAEIEEAFCKIREENNNEQNEGSSGFKIAKTP